MSERIRIAAFSRILPAHDLGGMQVVAQDILRGLAERHEVEVFTTERPGDGAPYREICEAGTRLHFLHTGAPGRYSAAWFAAADRHFRALHAERPFDVVLTFSAAVRPLVRQWRRDRLGVPVAATFFGTHLDELRAALHGARRGVSLGGIGTGLLRAGHVAYRALRDAPFMRAPDILIVPTPMDARKIATTFRVPLERFRVIPYGVAPALRRALAAVSTPGSPVVTVVTRLERDKGVQVLLPAIASVSRDVPGLELRVVGDGAYRTELAAMATALGIKDRVHFVGTLPYDEIATAYRGAGIVVNPRLRPTAYDHALILGLATGLPVIASDYGDSRFVAEPSRHALLIPPGDVAALAAAIRRCLAEPAWGSALGRAGRQRIEEAFTLEKTVGAYAAVLEGLADGRTPPAGLLPT